MIGVKQIQEILAQYEKHGWSLRRVLLSAENVDALPRELFGQTKIVSSELNALWFSRASFEGREAWELRHLSATPFAFVEVFENNDDEEVREQIRSEVETRMKEKASKIGNEKSSADF